MELQKFSYIPNHIEINADLPFQLIPGCDVKEANEQQIQLIELNLKKMGAFIGSRGMLLDNGSTIIHEIFEDGVHVQTKTLVCRNKRKYFVVTYEDEGISLLNLQFASNITEIPLLFDVFRCDVYENNYTFGYDPDLAFRFFSESDMTTQQTLNKENLEQIREIYCRFSSISDDFPEITNSIKLFNTLRYLHNYHDFKTLGLFSVIESLLTHKPTSSETGDSLTRQVRTKVPLLLRRAESGFNYGAIFKIQDESKIWKSLYDYRSALAHGRRPDFKKEFAILKDGMVIHDFLIRCIKQLFSLALIEPQLVTDLKEC